MMTETLLKHCQLQKLALLESNQLLQRENDSLQLQLALKDQELLLLEAKLHEVAKFEGVETLPINELHGKLLEYANNEIVKLSEKNSEMNAIINSLEYQLNDMKSTENIEIKTLKEEVRKLSDEISKRTVLYSAQERRWQDAHRQNESLFLSVDTRLAETTAKLSQLQSQYEKCDKERIEAIMSNRQSIIRQEELEKEITECKVKMTILDGELEDANAHNLNLQLSLDRLRNSDINDIEKDLVDELYQERTKSKYKEESLQKQLDIAKRRIEELVVMKDQLSYQLDDSKRYLGNNNSAEYNIESTLLDTSSIYDRKDVKIHRYSYADNQENSILLDENSSKCNEINNQSNFVSDKSYNEVLEVLSQLDITDEFKSVHLPISAELVDSAIGNRTDVSDEVRQILVTWSLWVINNHITTNNPIITSDFLTGHNDDSELLYQKVNELQKENNQLKKFLLDNQMKVKHLEEINEVIIRKAAEWDDKENQNHNNLLKQEKEIYELRHSNNELCNMIKFYKDEVVNLKEQIIESRHIGKQEASIQYDKDILSLNNQIELLQDNIRSKDETNIGLQNTILQKDMYILQISQDIKKLNDMIKVLEDKMHSKEESIGLIENTLKYKQDVIIEKEKEIIQLSEEKNENINKINELESIKMNLIKVISNANDNIHTFIESNPDIEFIIDNQEQEDIKYLNNLLEYFKSLQLKLNKFEENKEIYNTLKIKEIEELKQIIETKENELLTIKKKFDDFLADNTNDNQIKLLEDAIGLKDNYIQSLQDSIIDKDREINELKENVRNKDDEINRLENLIILSENSYNILELKTTEDFICNNEDNVLNMKDSDEKNEQSSKIENSICYNEKSTLDKDNTVRILKESIRSKGETKSIIEDTVHFKDDTLRKLKDDLIEKENIICDKENTIRRMEDTIAQMEDIISKNKDTINNCENIISQISNTIHNNEDTIVKMEIKIQDKDHTLTEIQDLIREMEDTIREKESMIDRIKIDLSNMIDTVRSKSNVIDNDQQLIVEKEKEILNLSNKLIESMNKINEYEIYHKSFLDIISTVNSKYDLFHMNTPNIQIKIGSQYNEITDSFEIFLNNINTLINNYLSTQSKLQEYDQVIKLLEEKIKMNESLSVINLVDIQKDNEIKILQEQNNNFKLHIESLQQALSIQNDQFANENKYKLAYKQLKEKCNKKLEKQKALFEQEKLLMLDLVKRECDDIVNETLSLIQDKQLQQQERNIAIYPETLSPETTLELIRGIIRKSATIDDFKTILDLAKQTLVVENIDEKFSPNTSIDKQLKVTQSPDIKSNKIKVFDKQRKMLRESVSSDNFSLSSSIITLSAS